MQIKCLSVFWILSWLPCLLFAQNGISDSVHPLSGVEIMADRVSGNESGLYIRKIDTSVVRASAGMNLGELLMQQCELYIKSYGPTGISSAGFRGSNSNQTALLWNGINLNNPMNGGADLSLVPSGFADAISIQYNGFSSLYGNGSMGGAIRIQNLPSFGEGIRASVTGSYASFGNYSSGLNLLYGSKKVSTGIRAFIRSGINNFPFINTAMAGSPVMKQQHAELMQYGLLQENHFITGKNSQLGIILWYQKSDRQIPPLMTSQFGKSEQKDESWRGSLTWETTGKKTRVSLRTAVLFDDYDYRDSIAGIYSLSHSATSVSEAEVYYQPAPDHSINIGVHNTYQQGLCNYYENAKHRNETALFASYRTGGNGGRWNAGISLRQSYAGGKFVPILPSLALEVLPLKSIIIYVNVSRNYRLPTLNDLYWVPGGNPALKPESGWTEELGIRYRQTAGKSEIHFRVTAYNSNTGNWIVWLPELSYWTPRNIRKVWSTGGEAEFRIKTAVGKTWLSADGIVGYVRAVNRYRGDTAQFNRQLMYTPQLSANGGITLEVKGFYARFGITYTGKRFTTPSQTTGLPAYTIGNLILMYRFCFRNFSPSLFVHCNNLWNTQYQTIIWQAMPGFNLRAGIHLDFNFKPKNIKP